MPWNQWWHLSLALTGFYALGRALKLSAHAAGAAAIWFGFACFTALNFENFLPQLFANSLAPWVLFSLLRLGQTRSFRHLTLSSALAAMLIWSGHLETAAHLFLLAGLGAATWAAMSGALFTSAGRRTGMILLLAGVTALGLALILILPSLEFVSHSLRALPLSYTFFTHYSSPLFIVFQWEYGQAALLFWLCFGLGAMAGRRDPRSRVALLLILFCIVYAGNLLQIQKLFFHLPGFSKFSSPWRMNYHEMILAGVLVGIGVERMLQSSRPWRWLVLMAIVLLLSWALPAWLTPEQVAAAAGAAPELPLLEYKHQVLAQYARCAPWLALAGAVILLGSLWRRRSGRGTALILGLTLFLGQWYLPALLYTPRRELSDYTLNPPYLAFLAQAPAGRMLTITAMGSFATTRILPQAGVLESREAVDAFISIPLLDYAGYVKAIFDRAYVLKDGALDEINFIPIFSVEGNFRETQIPLWDLMNLRYVVAGLRNFALGPDYHLLYTGDSWQNQRGAIVSSLIPGRPRLQTSSPFRLEQPDLYLEPETSLRFGLGLPAPAGGLMAAVILARRDDNGQATLLFSRVYGGSASGSTPYELNLRRLASTETLYRLTLAATPVGPQRGADKPGPLQWEDPLLRTPTHHFQRLPIPDLEVYQNPSAMPKAFLAFRPLVIPKFEDRVAYLKSGKFQPWSEVLLEEEPGAAISPEPPTINREGVEIGIDEPDRVGLRAAVGRSGWLVLTDVYFPGWRAWVDGKEIRIRRVDQTFRGLPLDPGLHSIRMRYQPRSFRLGLWVTLASLLSILFASSLRFYGKLSGVEEDLPWIRKKP